MPGPNPIHPHRVTPLDGMPAIRRDKLHFPLDERQLERHVRSALQEDGAFNDLTTIACVPSDTRRARATLCVWNAGVIAGVPFAIEAFRLLDAKVSIRCDANDGDRVASGTAVMWISGHARAMLSAERVALNYLQHLSGIATLTGRFVDAIRGTKARILDTRKTSPGLRLLEKYAVRAGGGTNHRVDLSDAVLIRDNHLLVTDGDIALAVRRARDLAPPDTRVEVECTTVEHVKIALAAGADIVRLERMTPALITECVGLARGRALTEAAGSITLDNVRAIADCGVDMISLGAITHSALAIPFALRFESA
ncbi:MAG: carboxylating nicotinate-nucleotide diphosphorylase [Gemmatimonadota bacterium]|nr:carboxylating nicotinate-nucleotide diphosphorylase [Gemmatimonadota bacterium]